MKVTIAQADLSSALHTIKASIQSGRTNHPILATVLLQATNADTLTLSGFDLKLSISTTILASVKTKGAIAVPYALLQPLVAKLPSDSPITLSAKDLRITLSTAAGNYTLTALDSADWPELTAPSDTAKVVTIPLPDLNAAIAATAHAASRDESKQLLQGIHLSLDPLGIQAAATDGHRLSIYGQTPPAATPAVTVQADTLQQLQHLQDSVTITSDTTYIRLADDHTIITSRILDGTYPDFAKLIPESFTTTITVDRIALLHAVQRIAIIADTHNSIIKLSAADTLTISADVELGAGTEQLAIDTTGKPLDFAVNARYLCDGLRALHSKQVTIMGNTPTTPVVINPTDDATLQTYLIMPVQIRS